MGDVEYSEILGELSVCNWCIPGSLSPPTYEKSGTTLTIWKDGCIPQSFIYSCCFKSLVKVHGIAMLYHCTNCFSVREDACVVALGLWIRKLQIASIAIWEDGHICAYSFGSMYEIVAWLWVLWEYLLISMIQLPTRGEFFTQICWPISSYHDHTVLWVCLNHDSFVSHCGMAKCDSLFISMSQLTGLSNRIVTDRQHTKLDPTRWAPPQYYYGC